ncbi:hypothetical protein DYBT9275_03144 [Dyadobacter sp. CECT 9275]|uniref:Uncharacterized protein n=1 Tax=Dyadobacter helix TaxID=2822344 RepID=A0A916NLZ1_9BACT|nr:hypothetical protein [Dyadobacter sp. CECT 9275]CAG5003402.1 hypothetical protein DYBT9275_03144 [Dyadobacter sp. CECT 9275]
MKTFLLTILPDADSAKIMNILQDLVDQKSIELKTYSQQPVSASEEQIDEMIDESELGPYYTEQEAKDILKL